MDEKRFPANVAARRLPATSIHGTSSREDRLGGIRSVLATTDMAVLLIACPPS
jgi:hypothetical protein